MSKGKVKWLRWTSGELEELRKFGKGATLQRYKDLVRWMRLTIQEAESTRTLSVSQSKIARRSTSRQCHMGDKVRYSTS